MPRKNIPQKVAVGTLEGDLAALPGLPLADLKDRWRELYGAPPPPKIGRALMVRAVAYRMQEIVFGGLRPVTRRRIARAAEDIAAGRTPAVGPSVVKPGPRLLREWKGVTHEVIILEEGVQYRGEVWPSLSAIAREITGARWSGPRLFGLRGVPR